MAFKLVLACPRHPKYDPRKGPDAIVGGCPNCWALVDFAKDVERVKRKMDQRLFTSLKDLERFEVKQAERVLEAARRVVRKVREGEELETEEQRLLNSI